ncbi:MAG: hypothetical protein JEY97_11160 [Bacteroidales bacterium]|nr:hypothetical protein [Bacteroidales bacterium]
MKKSTICLLISAIIIIFTQSCMNLYDQPAVEADDEKQDSIKNSIQTLNESMNDFNEQMETIDNMEQQLLDLEKMVNSGDITEDEMKKITDKYYSNNGKNETAKKSVSSVEKIPFWAKQLGLTEPRNMTLVSEKSMMTSFNNPSEGFNSITFVYKGQYENALNQAKIIAENANIPISKSWLKIHNLINRQKKDAEKYGNTPPEDLKGITYINYEQTTNEPEYVMSVSVDANGFLTIQAANLEQTNLQMDKYIPNKGRK